jgi:hypothetical protein
VHYRWEIQRIRAYYRGLVPPGLMFFADAAVQDSAAVVRQFLGVRARDLNVLLTVASMVAALIAVVLYLAHMRIAVRQYRVGLADLS